MEDREAHFLAKTRCSTEEIDKMLHGYCADVSDVEVVCGVPESWKQLSTPSSDTAVAETLGAGGGQEEIYEAQQREETTMYLASMDIKTVFDVARPKHIVNFFLRSRRSRMDYSGFLHEVASLEGQATFEYVDSIFLFTRCLRQGSVEAPWPWVNMTMQILSNVDPEWMKQKMGDLRGTRSSDLQHCVGGQ